MLESSMNFTASCSAHWQNFSLRNGLICENFQVSYIGVWPNLETVILYLMSGYSLCFIQFHKSSIIAQLHVSNGILMKFQLTVTSRLGALVAIENVLLSMEKRDPPIFKFPLCACRTVYSTLVKVP